MEDTWSIREAAEKLLASPPKRQEWLIAFKEGVDLDDTVLQDTFGQQIQQEFMARYDLSFLTPISQSLRCKVKSQFAVSCLLPATFRFLH